MACAYMQVDDYYRWFNVCKNINSLSNANGEIPHVIIAIPTYEMQNYPAIIGAIWSIASTLALTKFLNHKME